MSRLDLTQPDDLGAFIGKTLASFVSGNNQPDMSGDDRNRIRFPHIRDRYDRSCVALAAEIVAAVSPASQPGMNDGVAGENAPSLPEASPVGGGAMQNEASNCAADTERCIKLSEQEIHDAISDAIGDSMDMDWTYSDGAKAVMRAFGREGWSVVPLNTSPERVKKSAENEHVGGGETPKPGRCEMEEAVHAWLRDDASLSVKMAMTPAVRDALVDKALAVMSPRDEEGLKDE